MRRAALKPHRGTGAQTRGISRFRTLTPSSPLAAPPRLAKQDFLAFAGFPLFHAIARDSARAVSVLTVSMNFISDMGLAT